MYTEKNPKRETKGIKNTPTPDGEDIIRTVKDNT